MKKTSVPITVRHEDIHRHRRPELGIGVAAGAPEVLLDRAGGAGSAAPAAGARAGSESHQRTDSHVRRAQLRGERRRDPQWPDRQRRQFSARAHADHPRDRSARPHRRARAGRRPHPQREPRQSPRLSHDSREHGLHSRDPGGAGGSRKSVPEGQWITSMGGWHPNQWAEHRHPTLKELDEAVPDRPVLLYERFTGPAVTNSAGKKIFDALDARRARASRNQEGRSRRQRRHRRCRLRRRRTRSKRAVPPAAPADVRRQEAQHAGCDGLLGKRRPHGAPRSGALPHSRSASSESDSVQPGSVPDV